MSKRLHAKYPLFSSHFNKTRVSSTDFEKSSNIRFYENPSIGSRDVRYGQTYVCTDGQTDRHDEANNRVSNFIRAREMSESCRSVTLLSLHEGKRKQTVFTEYDQMGYEATISVFDDVTGAPRTPSLGLRSNCYPSSYTFSCRNPRRIQGQCLLFCRFISLYQKLQSRTAGP